MNPEQLRAVEIARANPDMNITALAREVAQPYSTVYGWLSRAGVVRERYAQRDALAQAEAATAAEKLASDRARLDELLPRYLAGGMVPKVDPGVVAAVVHDILTVRSAVARLRARSGAGALSHEERAALEALDGLVSALRA